MKRRIFLGFALIILGIFSINLMNKNIFSVNAIKNNTNPYFKLDDAKQIELEKNNALNISKTLKIQTKDGTQYDVVVNVLSKNKLVISPIEKLNEEVRINNVDNYKVSTFSGVVYVQNKKNMEKITKSLDRAVPVPYELDYNKSADIDKESTYDNAHTKSDYTNTNIQTKGIDEADIVKTDGKYIYYLKNNELVILNADPKNMKIMSKINPKPENFLKSIYIDKDKISLISISNAYTDEESNNYTNIDVYDIKNISKPKLLKTQKIKGFLDDTRKKDDVIYTTSTHYIPYEYEYRPNSPLLRILNTQSENKINYDYSELDFEKIIYLPFTKSDNIRTLSAFKTNSKNSINQISYLGEYDDTLYMSNNNIYISNKLFSFDEKYTTVKTQIVKFAIDDINFKYIGKNTIDGDLLNQFSMNESGDNLFVAYTSYDFENCVASFDKNMNIISQLSGLAKGERIYSSRFIKDKLYMVTFKQVDPLFTIDLKNPKQMKVLGYLKIPGYSQYLHPYKENYLIGFGQNTIAQGENVLNDGFKMSLFDISDFNNPKEVDVESIGSRGTFSTIQNDHKALMFDEKRNILSIPIEVTKSEKKYMGQDEIQNITTTFIGAYVYDVTEQGFDIKGRITHYTEKEALNMIYEKYEYEKQIQRILQIGDNLYTISNYAIKVNDINTLKEIKTFNF